MSLGYQAVGWNRTKKIYDTVLVAGLVLYLGVFLGIGSLVHPNATAETLLIRALGTAALLLLHVILCIGPLCRLDRRFLPLLYNRRHLGVTMFVLALAHGTFSIFQFHALGNLNPLVSLFVSNTSYTSLADFPFQALGFFALLILFLMAATSHDFWLHNLTAPVWKRLHMLVYVAYGLLIAHVTLGALQSETSPLLAAVLAAGLTTVTALHLASAAVERRNDRGARCRQQRICTCLQCRQHSRKSGRVLSRAAVSASRYSNTMAAYRPSPMSASTRMDRLEKARSSTDASRARGTATNTCPIRAHLRRPSPKRSRPSGPS